MNDTLFIVVNGRLTNEILKDWQQNLKREILPDRILLFCQYSDQDIPIGTVFNCMSDHDKPVFKGMIELVFVSQQFFRPFSSIHKGWQTIAEFKFTPTLPTLIAKELPIIESWHSTNRVEYKILNI